MRMRAKNSNALVVPTIFPCYHLFKPLFSDSAHGLSRMLWSSDVCRRDIIRWKIAGDGPPSYPFRPNQALDGPDRHARSKMPSWPIADLAVLDSLGNKVIGNDCSLLLT